MDNKINFSWIAKCVSDSMLVSQIDNPMISKLKKEDAKKVLDISKKLPAKKETLSDKETKLINKYSEPKYGPIFYEIKGVVHYKGRIGETVIIQYVESSKDCLLLAHEIQKIAWARGCHVMRVPLSSNDLRERYKTAPDNTLFELSKLSLGLIRSADVSITVGDEEDPEWSRGLEEKLAYGAKASRARYNAYEKARGRSALLSIPIKRKGFVSQEKYFSVFYDSLKETFSKKMIKIIDNYEEQFKNKDLVRITANDGTDLSFSIKNRVLLRDDALAPEKKVGGEHYNFPAGEVFVAPVETSAEGTIIFDYVTPRGFGLIRDLKMVFKKGKAVEFSAKGDGAKKFKKFLDANTGKKDMIGEFGIGCNPGAKFIGTTIVDEKIYGSIHIAIGWNKGPFKGKNEASSHQDMIKILKGKQGNVYADGKIVIKNGMPV